MIETSNIHCALMPYLVEQARVATQNGLPLMRHMILAFPDDKRGYDLEDQYMRRGCARYEKLVMIGGIM